MYLRRHCYNKPHRCPGWSGGGWTGTYDDVEPDTWDEEIGGPWAQSSSRRRHWWQRRDRCPGGSLRMYPAGAEFTDPWMAWRWHRCSRCDVLTLPIVVQWLDPTWWRHVLVTDVWWPVRDLRYHRSRWEDPPGAPWWSLPDAIWRGVRWRTISRLWRLRDWLTALWRWYAPRA